MTVEMDKRVDAMGQLLLNKGWTDEHTVDDYRHKIGEEWLPTNGATLCVKAWTDPHFKEFLLADGKAAAASLGFAMPEHHGRLAVLENTQTVHNIICCTLCSCTAFTIIGIPPGWYKNFEYRARIVRQARTVLAELGLVLPPEMTIRVWDTTADTRYMVLPLRPAATEGWSQERLMGIISKESMIGAARLEAPFGSTARAAAA